jgi:ribonucleoside-diphosphate reductase alpha chain
MGSTLSGILDALSMCMSVALQAGVPLSWFVEKLRNLQFEPSGTTDDPKVRYATSIVDGLAKWLEYRVLTGGGESGPPTPG